MCKPGLSASGKFLKCIQIHWPFIIIRVYLYRFIELVYWASAL